MLIHPYTKETARQFLQDAIKSEQLAGHDVAAARVDELPPPRAGEKDAFSVWL
jgi:hypothetical protein